jgi:hypothetical protein
MQYASFNVVQCLPTMVTWSGETGTYISLLFLLAVIWWCIHITTINSIFHSSVEQLYQFHTLLTDILYVPPIITEVIFVFFSVESRG